MSERAYNRLANTFMLLAVLSALLFDSGRLPHVVVGTFGVISGLAAIALYFWNQLDVKKKASEEHVVPHVISDIALSKMEGYSTNEAKPTVWR